jgi:1-acyl-sn-glycerol-3-phosphate acyltransferase
VEPSPELLVVETPTASTLSPAWPRMAWARAIRAVLQRFLLLPITRWCCRPLVVTGRDRLPAGPVLLVANHASHADTAAVLLALPPRLRKRLAPAAAEDHFFRRRAVGAAVSLLTGAFPFPRRGRAGIERAASLLDSGWSVLLFPEGTRAGGRFRCGAGILAARGTPVVPVGIAGTAEMLPKGRLMPRHAHVRIAFGEPSRFDASTPPDRVAAMLEARVRMLAGGPSSRRLRRRVRGRG